MKKIFLKRGFSLVEMLVALIAISCIIAAFAPVMTKKMNAKLNLESGGWDGILYTFNENYPGCKFVASGLGNVAGSVECSFIVPDRVNTVNTIMVSGGGGGGDGSNLTSGRITESAVNGGTNYVTITSSMKNVKLDFLIGGGGGGGTAGVYSEPSCPSNSYLVNYSGTKYCIYERAGDGGPSTGSINSCFLDKESALYGNCPPRDTSPACLRSYMGEYGSVCNYAAAEQICSSVGGSVLNWELSNQLTDYQYSGLNAFTDSALLMSMENADVPYICSGGYGFTCSSDIWGGIGSKGSKSVCSVSAGSGGRRLNCVDWRDDWEFHPVYCYTSATSNSSKTYAGGGGGGSGAGVKNISIPDSIIQANIGGRIKLSAGSGGAAYSICSNLGSCYTELEGLDGGNGTQSRIEVLNTSGYTKWGYIANGGYGGGGANNLNKSKGAASKSNVPCQYSSTGSSWANVSCDSYSNNKGLDGTGYTGVNTIYNAPGGDGGGTIIDNYGYSCNGCGGGAGGSYGSSGFAVDASYYGAGGGGGSAEVYRSISYGNGAAGAGGIAQISYESPKGRGGTGGGGCTLMKFENIPVIPNKQYRLFVGDGGLPVSTCPSGSCAASNGGYSKFSFEGGWIIVSPGSAGYSGGYITQWKKDSNIKASASYKIENSESHNGGYDVMSNYAGATTTKTIAGAKIKITAIAGASDAEIPEENSSISKGSKGGGVAATCGGLDASCNNGSSINGKDAQFVYPGDIVKQYNYGAAGQGGGGGGWSAESGTGKGGKGAPGYIYIYWKKPK